MLGSWWSLPQLARSMAVALWPFFRNMSTILYQHQAPRPPPWTSTKCVGLDTPMAGQSQTQTINSSPYSYYVTAPNICRQCECGDSSLQARWLAPSYSSTVPENMDRRTGSATTMILPPSNLNSPDIAPSKLPKMACGEKVGRME